MRTYFLAACLFLAACGDQPKAEAPAAQPAAQPAPVHPDERPAIVAFGDSLSAGFGVDAGQSYPDFLQKELDRRRLRYHVVNGGNSGDTSSDGLDRLQQVLALKPAIVIVEFGANDGLRGVDPSSASPQQFVICIQNHDQVGNRADGARLNHEIDPAAYRALSVLLLLCPETPLLFMGQEWAASTPFLFFTDHHEELGRQVTAGRREEFSAFAAFRDPMTRGRIPDPQEARTFERSRLCWNESGQSPHLEVRRLYQRLLALRRDMPRPARQQFSARALDQHTVALSLSPSRNARGHLVIARLSGDAGEVTLQTDTGGPTVLLTTEDRDLVVDPHPIGLNVAPAPHRDCGRSQLRLRFTRPGAVVLGDRLAT